MLYRWTKLIVAVGAAAVSSVFCHAASADNPTGIAATVEAPAIPNDAQRTNAATVSASPPSKKWTSLYAFGDSYSDTGAGYVDGNGPTAVAYMAEALNVPFTYVGDPARSDTTGLNFAVSGAQTGDGYGFYVQSANPSSHTRKALFGRGMKRQVADFVGGVTEGSIQFVPKTTLFFLAGGLNDSGVPTQETIANLKDEIRQLYRVGARNFSLAILPTKIPPFHAVAKRLNPAILSVPTQLSPELPGAHVALNRWGADFDEVISAPSKYGIKNTTSPCAMGREVLGYIEAPCAEPNAYFYYHDGHPSTAVHRIVGQLLADEAQQKFH